MTPSATAWLVTAFLLPYVICIDLLVGGLVMAAHAKWRGTPVHRALLTRLRRALPGVLYAVAVSGVAALTLVRSAYPGAAGIGWVAVSGGARVPGATHLLLAAGAVTGTALALAARHAAGIAASDARAMGRYGAGWAVFCTLANLLVGVVWMLRLPRETALRFTGGDTGAMLVFSIAVIAAVLALGFLAMSLTVPRSSAYVDAGAAGLLVTLAMMVWIREAVRDSAAAVVPVWPALAFGGVLVLIALAAVRGAWRAFARP